AASARHTLPATVPPRVGRILDTADQVASILTVAGRHGGLRPGSASGAAAREDALRPLWDAVRTARRAAATAVARHSPQT
ncbi:hypothetical protein Q8814_12585, partial [Rhodococcus sp. CC-R104]|nr:hypothetical protein [Rhodococcus sp. CC-R104]